MQRIMIRLENENMKTEWFVALSDAISKAETETYSMKSDHNPLTQVFKDNLYDALRSRVFCDDVSLNSHVKALNEIVEMFKDTIKKVKAETSEKCQELTPKIAVVENLAYTMEKLITNVLEEIEDSHDQMFKILESVAVLEQDKSSRVFSRTQGSSNDDTQSESSNFSNFEYSAPNKGNKKQQSD
jgi:hypothetical protein